MSSSSSDVEMTEDKVLDVLHQTIMDAVTKLASRSSTRRRQRTYHQSYIEWDCKLSMSGWCKTTPMTYVSIIHSIFVKCTTYGWVFSSNLYKCWVIIIPTSLLELTHSTKTISPTKLYFINYELCIFVFSQVIYFNYFVWVIFFSCNIIFNYFYELCDFYLFNYMFYNF